MSGEDALRTDLPKGEDGLARGRNAAFMELAEVLNWFLGLRFDLVSGRSSSVLVGRCSEGPASYSVVSVPSWRHVAAMRWVGGSPDRVLEDAARDLLVALGLGMVVRTGSQVARLPAAGSARELEMKLRLRGVRPSAVDLASCARASV